MNLDVSNNSTAQEILRILDQEKQFHLDRINQIKNIEQILTKCCDDFTPQYQPATESGLIAFANGMKIPDEEFPLLDEGDFDVILNLNQNILRFRKDPARRSKLKLSKLEGIGPHRIKILAYLLQHPTRFISFENVNNLYGHQERIIERQTFNQSICFLRKALEQQGPEGPYIVSMPAWDTSGSRNACRYILNDKRQYLLIKDDAKIIAE